MNQKRIPKKRRRILQKGPFQATAIAVIIVTFRPKKRQHLFSLLNRYLFDVSVDRWSLIVVRWSLIVDRCSLFVVRCSLFVGRCSLFVVRCSLFVVRWSVFVVRWSLSAHVDSLQFRVVRCNPWSAPKSWLRALPRRISPRKSRNDE
jgi:hypothetical protein